MSGLALAPIAEETPVVAANVRLANGRNAPTPFGQRPSETLRAEASYFDVVGEAEQIAGGVGGRQPEIAPQRAEREGGVARRRRGRIEFALVEIEVLPGLE